MALDSSGASAPLNRLARETSPYLLQHARNPVDWYPWGEEALERARREDKPILLSIGYSACHWCHVMERESFCNEQTARLMNRHFVCIKVDREERPDLDEIYMAATIAMSGSGGWPMTVFLTPGQEPFFAGTYFPPKDGYGRPGFPSLLARIAELWQTERQALSEQAQALVAEVRARARATSPAAVGQAALDRAVTRLAASFDATFGGFSGAPKFPAPLSLEVLLRHHRRTGEQRSLDMVTTTLDAMAHGGIRDHLGGGFARYSTDERWLVPHFEKMLYDNAALARIYADAYRVTKSEEYRRVTEETLDWVLREMTSPEGGFFSATDADSEGEEGRYFVWQPAQVHAALPREQAEAVCAFYDVREQGNWEHQSILHTPRRARDVAIELGCSVAELEQRLADGRARLLAVRSERVPPACDDKVLTAWNGLMIGALAECGRLLDEPRYVDAAERAAQFLWGALRRPDGSLHRSYRKGDAKHEGVLEDYAYLADALIDLYEAGGDLRWLARARELCQRISSDFADEQAGGFYATSRDHERLLVRYRDGQDGAVPNANAVAARALARLSFFTDDRALRQRAVDAIAAYGKLIDRAPEAFAGSLRVLDLLLEGPVEAVLVGEPDDAALHGLCRELGRHYLPNRIIVHPVVGQPPLPLAAGLLEGRGPVDGKAAAYLCRQLSCQAPVSDPSELAAALRDDQQQGTAGRQRKVARSRLGGSATAAGTSRYAERLGAEAKGAGYRPLGRTGLVASRLGFGGYRIDERATEHGAALRQALRQGVNLVDTSTNYTDGDSERLIGSALRELIHGGSVARDEVIVVSKIGYVQGENLVLAKERQRSGEPFPEMVRYAEQCWHCIHPSYLADQLDRSLDRLGLEVLDVALLHNPEYFLSEAKQRGIDHLEPVRDEFYERIERAFAFFEQQVQEGRISSYGVSSNTVAAPADDPEATDLSRMLEAAQRAGGPQHHFAVLQLPLNLLESRAVLQHTATGQDDGALQTVLAQAGRAQLGVLVNRPLNAFGSAGLVRLADPVTGPEREEAGDSFGSAVDRLEELESEFSASFGPALRGVPQGRAADLLCWAPQLRRLDDSLGSSDQLRSIASGQVLPRTARVLSAVEQGLGGPLRGTFAAWQHSYRSALEACFASLRGQIHRRAAARARAIVERIDPLLDPARRDEPLSRKALWVLASTPGVDVVLLGMRRPSYVDDALAIMPWPALSDVDAVYRAMAAARTD
ncbi:MAG: DUF255 domain-containing protein [Deltaproteobacteria bacterium]|jgi:uncharacterized protein YyaL (SSP411 family)/aryl-alcohol dehydrogenase-like predicted oxidoreductase|nr:DUF255 domain-containing protein [Deltaproteobacteria bacterium]MBW2530500.1 DUF255 domain-containing protein [Deltaproteobacteria bacterium]